MCCGRGKLWKTAYNINISMSRNREWHKKQNRYRNWMKLTRIYRPQFIETSSGWYGAPLLFGARYWQKILDQQSGMAAGGGALLPFLHPLEMYVLLTLLFSDIFRLSDLEDTCKLGSTFSSNTENRFALLTFEKSSHHKSDRVGISPVICMDMSYAADLKIASIK